MGQIQIWLKVYSRPPVHRAGKYIERWGIIVNGQANFGNKITCTISRNGDLIWRTYLEVTLPALTATNGQVSWVQKLGHALINNITLEIGGQQIDKHYADWLNIWTDLTLPAGQKVGYAAMIGDTVALQTPAASQPATELYIPLQFYFNRNPGLIGHKSNLPCASERCCRDNLVGSQGAPTWASYQSLVTSC
jgi:hypothetical protein